MSIKQQNIPLVIAHSLPLTGASVQLLPFLAEHWPQRPTLYGATGRKRTRNVWKRNQQEINLKTRHRKQNGTFCPETHLNVAHGVSLLIDVLAVGNHLFYLSALKEIQLQQLRHILTEVNCIKHTQQLPAHWWCEVKDNMVKFLKLHTFKWLLTRMIKSSGVQSGAQS